MSTPIPTLRLSSALCVAVLLLAAAAPSLLHAQSAPPRDPVPQRYKEARISSHLVALQEAVEKSRIDEQRSKLRRTGAIDRTDGRFLVAVYGPLDAEPVDAAALTGIGAEIQSTYLSGRNIWIAPGQLGALEALLPSDFVADVVRRPIPDYTGQGPTVTNSEDYAAVGSDGSGITLAVVDSGFEGLFDTSIFPEIPTGSSLLTAMDLTGEGIQNGGDHGTLCLEQAYDHAPGASYRLYKVANGIDLGAAVDHAQWAGTDIITHSLSNYNSGWGDDSGFACAAANDAASSGILFFTSAGNRALTHWQGAFADADGDDAHEWVPGDELNQIVVRPFSGAAVYLSWNDASSATDYDLYLTEPGGAPFGSSVSGPGQFEVVGIRNDTASSVTYEICVEHVAGPAAEFEIFCPGRVSSLERTVAAGSTTSPSNATDPNVIAVAAVGQLGYRSSVPVAKNYSSQGPTNGGNRGVDLAGPTDVTSGIRFPGSFGGTSCATPNLAGMAACAWSCAPSASADEVRDLLFAWSANLADWGAIGPDTIYGMGGGLLPNDDCDGDGLLDGCAILSGNADDANGNGIPDGQPCEGFGFVIEIPERIEPCWFLASQCDFVLPIRAWQSPIDPEYGQQIFGFSFSLAFSSSVVTAFGAEPGRDIMLLGGGQGPDFFSVDILNDGLVGGCVFDFLGNEGLPFDQTRELALIDYDAVVQLQSSGVPSSSETSFDLVDGMGSPPINNSMVIEGGQEVSPALRSAVVEFHEASPFRFELDPLESVGPGSSMKVFYDPNDGLSEVTITPGIADDSDTGVPVEGFAMLIAHDEQLLEVETAELSPWVMSLNGGQGPEFSEIQLEGNVVAYGVLFGDSHLMGDFQAMGVVEYNIGGFGQLIGTETTSTTLITLPGDTNENLVVVDGSAHVPRLSTIGICLAPLDLAPEFVRGDLNSDGAVVIADAVYGLNNLFAGGPDPSCADTADVNDDGGYTIADMVYLLSYLFSGGTPPPLPFPDCGADPTDDSLSCDDPVCP